MKKRCFALLAFSLAFVVGSYFLIVGTNVKETDSIAAEIRTISVADSVSKKYKDELSYFDSYTIDDNEVCPSITATTEFQGTEDPFFDYVALDDGILPKDYTVTYTCSFDMEKLQYTLTAILLNPQGEEVERESMITDAFVTEAGGLDAYIELEGQTFLLSDFCKENGVDNCGWFAKALAKVCVSLVLAITDTAEQIKCRLNYSDNKKLEKAGQGVSLGNYITNQWENTKKGYKSATYKFGFAYFCDTGCEVASVYNLLIALARPEKLSEAIYKFEKWCIEFSVGFGFLGSNPLEIYRYLKKAGIKYEKYTSYTKLEKAVNKQKQCHIIFSRFEKSALPIIHTFYIKKVSSANFRSFNWQSVPNFIDKDFLSDFNDGYGFIVGYVVA